MNDAGKRTKSQLTLTIILLIFALLLMSAAAFAWFSKMRELKTAAQIAEPNPMAIKAGNQSDPLPVNIPSIDLTRTDDPETEENEAQTTYVFSVLSDVYPYNIVLAHTTNIPVTYKIYKVNGQRVNVSNKDADTKYGDYQGEWFYPYEDELIGAYRNNKNSADQSLPPLAEESDDYHDATYGDAAHTVQKNAQILYWVGEVTEQNAAEGNIENVYEGGYKYIDYFVLVISWKNVPDNYSKETDMVYLIAGTD